MVLRGSDALAVPTKMGQSLKFESNDSKILKWESWDSNNQLWFNATLNLEDFRISNTNDSEIGIRLVQILKAVRDQKSNFLREKGGTVKTTIDC